MAFFSIIVTALNAESTIYQTLQSILSQTFSDYEIVVKDGMSTDGTIASVPKSSCIKTVVKKDNGIYQGMNQGIVEATGQYCCFMNCGDLFYDENVLQRVYAFISKNGNNGIFYGNYCTKGHFTQCQSVTTRRSIYRSPLCHQTMFIKRNLFNAYGLYREDMKFLADYEFTVHCVTEGIACKNTQITVCLYQGDGVSAQKKNQKMIQKEYKEVRERYFAAREVAKYNLINALTLPWLRKWLASDKSPYVIKKIYVALSNKAKK